MIRLLTAFAALVFALPVLASELGDDGLHKAAWFQDTFKDLQEDQAEAQAEGKQLLLIVEQRGCLYCKDMHEGAFMDARVLELLSDVYYPVQINLHGDTEMVDTDGEALSEKMLRANGVSCLPQQWCFCRPRWISPNPRPIRLLP